MIKVKKDLTGLKFGRLTVVKQGDDYICHKHNDSCKNIAKCREIFEKESTLRL